jgi:ribonuclease VapC
MRQCCTTIKGFPADGNAMVIDTSAVIAILLAEEDAERYARAIELAVQPRMSAASYVEAAVVIDNRGDVVARREFDRFIRRAGIEVVAVSLEQAEIARQAYRDFGKGRHPAGLNFGDCFSYALAKLIDEPLLFKGTDFSLTDARAEIL